MLGFAGVPVDAPVSELVSSVLPVVLPALLPLVASAVLALGRVLRPARCGVRGALRADRRGASPCGADSPAAVSFWLDSVGDGLATSVPVDEVVLGTDTVTVCVAEVPGSWPTAVPVSCLGFSSRPPTGVRGARAGLRRWCRAGSTDPQSFRPTALRRGGRTAGPGKEGPAVHCRTRSAALP